MNDIYVNLQHTELLQREKLGSLPNLFFLIFYWALGGEPTFKEISLEQYKIKPNLSWACWPFTFWNLDHCVTRSPLSHHLSVSLAAVFRPPLTPSSPCPLCPIPNTLSPSLNSSSTRSSHLYIAHNSPNCHRVGPKQNANYVKHWRGVHL